MADIEVIIKIPEEEYRWIKKSDKTVFADVASKECMLHAIKNGIPLSKGHGRIIDESKINEVYAYTKEAIYKNIKYIYTEITHTDAPTIIEADKKGEE